MTLAEPVTSQLGQIVSAYEVQSGTNLTVATSNGLAFLTVEDLDDFADDGGFLRLRQRDDVDQETDPITYTRVDRTTSRIYLATVWDSVERGDYAIGDDVWIDPPSTERRADVALDGERDQTISARIPFGLTPSIPLGVRPVGEGEWVRVRIEDYSYEIVDGVGEYALTDPSSIIITDPDTGEPIGGIGADASFDTVTAEEIISPSVPRRNYVARTIYVDPVAGSDDNDGSGFYPLVDLFERSNASAWGTADSGHVWTTVYADGVVDVGVIVAGQARTRLPNASSQKAILRSSFAPLDAEIFGIFYPETQAFPGAGTKWSGPAGRIVDQNNYLDADISVNSAGAHTLEVRKVIGGTGTVHSSDALGTFPLSTGFYIRAQILTNQDGGTDVRAKAWTLSSGLAGEPDDWQISGNATDAVVQNAAGVGYISANGGSATLQTTSQVAEMRADAIDPDGNVVDTSGATVGPLASITAALDLAGDWNDADVRIVTTGVFDEAVFVNGLAGGGRVFLAGGGTTTIYGVIRLYGVTQYVEIRDLTIQDTGDGTTSGSIEIRTSRHVEIVNVKIQSNSARAYNVNFGEGADGRVQDSQLNGATTFCVQVAEESTVYLSDNKGAGGSGGSYRSSISILWVNGGKPTGATSTTFGGQIFGTTSSNDSGTPPPTSTKVTKTFAPNASRTWRPEWGWRDDNDETYQGEYAGSGGLSRGAAFYGTKLNVAGKTADSGKIFVKRLSSGGASQDQAIYLCSHDLGSQPGSDSTKPVILDGPTKIGSLAWGEGKWFDIPKAWVQSMLNGAGGRRGFMLYNDSASPYVIAAGKKNGGDVWKVKFTYH